MKKIIILTIFLALSPASIIFAKDFIVGPAKVEITVLNGETRNFEIIVANRLDRDNTFSVSVSPVSSGKNGETVAISEVGNANYDASSFLSFEKEVFVAKGEVVSVPVSVTVPKDALPGSHYAVLLVKNSPQEESAISASTELGSLIFVRVPGEVLEEGNLNSFELLNRPFVSFSGKTDFVLNFENKGNTHLNPYGVLVVENIFGKEASVSPIEPFFVFGESERKFVVSTDLSKAFGFYKAKIYLNRGYGDIVDEKVISFFLMPVWFIALIVCVLAVLFLKLKNRKIVSVVAFVLTLSFVSVSAQVMESGNYKLEFDSVNFGGGRSGSTNFNQESTFGEIATGYSGSTNYKVHAGYQQLMDVFISITDASDVTLLPTLGSVAGGVSDGSTTVTVTTDSPAGYELSIRSSSNPSLSSGTDSFADYPTLALVPDFSFLNANGESRFAFSPKGNDIVTEFLDNGSTCGVGALNTSGACWDGLTTTATLISQALSANNPTGSNTSVYFKAGIGSGRNQTPGNYEATITLTAIAL